MTDFTAREHKLLDSAIRLLRDRHYNNYYNAKDQNSAGALHQLQTFQELETLRETVRSS
jgi:hypothetical protein